MAASPALLTAEEVNTVRAAIRAGRYLAIIALFVGVPLLLPAITPVVGVALLTVILLSPVLVTAVLVMAARQTAKERRQASA
jgi:uncharacterized membrane protein